MINRILATAVKFFLRSQVERVENLQLKIGGKSRQILQGYIPQIWLSCDRLIYQGLHLHQVEVNGADIGFNLTEVLQQKPFRLLEPITIEIKFSLSSADLQGSLNSPLLQVGLRDLWDLVAVNQNQKISKINWQKLAIAPDTISLSGTYDSSDKFDGENSGLNKSDGEQIQKLDLDAGIALADHHTLNLSPIKIYGAASGVESLEEGVKIDLGTDVAIEQLRVESQQIYCSGKIVINN